MKISMALDKIDERQLFVPMFQREYVWKRDDARLLIDSLIKEYPIGTMLTWETNKPPKIKGNFKYNKKQGSVLILLDGQQRLATLYMLIRGKIPPYYTEQEISNDTRGLYVNVETLNLEYHSSKMENDPRWQSITDIFLKHTRTLDIVRNLEEKGEEVSRERMKNLDDNMGTIDSIHGREFVEQTVPPKATVHQAIDIFHKVNSGGVGLTNPDLAMAQISGYWPEARDTFKRKLTMLEDKGFKLNLTFILYVLLGCLYHQGSDIRKLHAADNNARIRNAWQRLNDQVLDYVIDIMRDHAYVDHSSEMRSIYALIPIIVFCYDRQGKPLNDQEIRKLVRWFYYSQLGLEYIQRLPGEDLDRDLQIIHTSKNPLDELLEKMHFWGLKHSEIPSVVLIGTPSANLFSRVIIWYFRSRGVCCLQTGKKLRANVGKEHSFQFQPIFPSSQLTKLGYINKVDMVFGSHPWVDELANQAILTTEARKRSAKHAKPYLATFADNYPDALALQCIPENRNLWEGKNFENFQKIRRKMLADGLNSFLKGITNTPHQEATVDELIKKGEGQKLEFKSSLRWSSKESTVKKSLEDAVVKVIASFLNTNGGTLLIGVDDEGTVLGLANDYRSLRGGKDEFERHLRRVLGNNFDTSFVAANVKTLFPKVGGHEICQLEVEESHKPMVISPKNEHGRIQGKFYIRNGNASNELSTSEMLDYISKKFWE